MPQMNNCSHTSLLASSTTNSNCRESSQEKYIWLCEELVSGRLTPEFRWQTFCDISDLRVLLREQGHNASNYGLRTNGKNEIHKRAKELLLGVISHFDDEHLYTATDAVTQDIFSSKTECELIARLQAASTWEACEEYMTRKRYATTQEDVLSQELRALATALKLPWLLEVSSWVRLLRSRFNALATWNAVGEILCSHANSGSKAISLGSGSTQFEEIVCRRTGINIDAIDIVKPPENFSKYNHVHHVLEDIEKYCMDPANGFYDLIILKDILHELPNPRTIISSATDKLNNGGMILLIEPHYNKSDFTTLRTMMELDSTAHKSSFMSHEEISAELTHDDISRISFQKCAPGVIDNNDSFERGIWIYNKHCK